MFRSLKRKHSHLRSSRNTAAGTTTTTTSSPQQDPEETPPVRTTATSTQREPNHPPTRNHNDDDMSSSTHNNIHINPFEELMEEIQAMKENNDSGEEELQEQLLVSYEDTTRIATTPTTSTSSSHHHHPYASSSTTNFADSFFENNEEDEDRSSQQQQHELYQAMIQALQNIQDRKQLLQQQYNIMEQSQDNNNNPTTTHLVQSHGQALEFYQKWRIQLIAWTGAVRNLNQRLEPLEQAFHELQTQVANLTRWKETDQDFHQLLLSSSTTTTTNITKDEFGRDVGNQAARAAQKRRQQRQKIRQQRQEDITGDESDAYQSDQELEDLRERDVALTRALEAATNELDEEYSNLHGLFLIFKEWHDSYPEDYQESYASLSLADLASVFVRLELCHLNDPMNESASFNEARWTTIVQNAIRDGTMNQPAVERLVEKSCLRSISDLLGKEGYNLVSSRQTRALADFCTKLSRIVDEESASFQKIRTLFREYIFHFLQNITLPIPKNEPIEVSEDGTMTEHQYELHLATYAPIRRLSKVLLNVLQYWGPLLEDDVDFVSFLLDFISGKFLNLLSALKPCHIHPFKHTPMDIFQGVWDALCGFNWVDAPEYMILAAPIRAAAKFYQLKEEEEL